jgi:hypothetical protein
MAGRPGRFLERRKVGLRRIDMEISERQSTAMQAAFQDRSRIVDWS